jgi:hypothetical protein
MTTKTTPKPDKKVAKASRKVVTFRFTLTPEMEKVFLKLEKKYAMLDRTEIVKLGISKLNNDITDDDTSSQNAHFDTYEEAMEFWNQNKQEFRL